MVFARLHFAPMQPDQFYSSLVVTDAHIAIAQYKQGKAFWFDRLPQVGEMVSIPSPQQPNFVLFHVDQVEHRPREVEAVNLVELLGSTNSWVILSPPVPPLE